MLAGAAMVCLFMPAGTGGVNGSIPKKVYTYSVNHPTHGDIGTYTNTIEQIGDETTVLNEVRVRVKVLVVVAYDHTGDSKELWREGRLVSIDSVNRENGKESVVKGHAQGGKFIVETPKGRVEAPGSVVPNNPWSMNILKAKLLLGTSTGNLYNVTASSGEEQTIKLGDRSVKTQYYKVSGDADYEIWFDDKGVPVKFTESTKDGVIAFRLTQGQKKPAKQAKTK